MTGKFIQLLPREMGFYLSWVDMVGVFLDPFLI